MAADDLQAGWDAAIAECLHGHENCTYGGLSASGGYWLSDVECERSHHDTCAWCDAEPTCRFVGWDGAEIYGVPACDDHGNRWRELHPGEYKGASGE